MAINGVLRPGHVAIRVSEMEAAVRHYTEVLGLIETARDAQGRVFLKAWDEHDHGRRLARRGAELPPACMSDGDDPRTQSTMRWTRLRAGSPRRTAAPCRNRQPMRRREPKDPRFAAFNGAN